jgi:hypothetical protein
MEDSVMEQMSGDVSGCGSRRQLQGSALLAHALTCWGCYRGVTDEASVRTWRVAWCPCCALCFLLTGGLFVLTYAVAVYKCKTCCGVWTDAFGVLVGRLCFWQCDV